jgi:hypothetical protein
MEYHRVGGLPIAFLIEELKKAVPHLKRGGAQHHGSD